MKRRGFLKVLGIGVPAIASIPSTVFASNKVVTAPNGEIVAKLWNVTIADVMQVRDKQRSDWLHSIDWEQVKHVNFLFGEDYESQTCKNITAGARWEYEVRGIQFGNIMTERSINGKAFNVFVFEEGYRPPSHRPVRGKYHGKKLSF